MTKLVVAAGALALATAAFAGPDKSPTEINCAVMTDHKVNIKKATASKMYADYKGNRYYFCCGGCPAQFKANPAKYSKNAHVKTPKKG